MPAARCCAACPAATSTCCATRTRCARVLGYLPQDFGVYPKVSAQDLLDHFARLKGLVDARGAAPDGRRAAAARQPASRCASSTSAASPAACGSASASRRRCSATPKLVIVDEPTAGLDPEERVRFHNLLADIAADVVVILSTHIVSDVADLCGQLAVIDAGRVLLTGEPDALVAAIRGPHLAQGGRQGRGSRRVKDARPPRLDAAAGRPDGRARVCRRRRRRSRASSRSRPSSRTSTSAAIAGYLRDPVEAAA